MTAAGLDGLRRRAPNVFAVRPEFVNTSA